MGSTISNDLNSVAQVPLAATTGFDGVLWPEQTILKDNASYDYIVVGGGSAGCVVARRLAETKNDTVLMLEAGGNPPKLALVGNFLGFIAQAIVINSDVSKNGANQSEELALFFNLLPHTFVDYNYTSTKDEYGARGQNNFTMITAGKMLGGTDSLNHFVHLRGTASDYDCWAKITNDESWKFKNILQYFKKCERVDDKEILTQYGEFHGTDGPMGLTRTPRKESIDLLKAFAEVGNPTVLDLNADTYVGYTEPQFMLADKKRQTPGYVYLKPILDYPNLHVSKYTRVTKIIFKGNVAVGVEANYKDKTYTLRAKKEVILSAGVFNTPQLLMLSGIGPKAHLDSFKIPVIKDLPVGSGLVDQVSVSLVHKLQKYPIPLPNVLAIDPLRIPFPVLVGSVALNKSYTCPDYQTFNLLFSHDTPFLTVACATVFGLRNEICDRWQKQAKFRDTLYTILTHLQPKSRGSVCLGSADPFADPVITTGYYKNKDDLKDMIKFVKDHIAVYNTIYFNETEAELAGLDLIECAGKEKDSDDFWGCYILQHTHSPYHFASTCAMGKVVDSKLRVKGMKRLRIVDASVMPRIPRAAPNAAIIMLAEKASDIIRNDNKQP